MNRNYREGCLQAAAWIEDIDPDLANFIRDKLDKSSFVSNAERRRYEMSMAKGGWYDGRPCPRCADKESD